MQTTHSQPEREAGTSLSPIGLLLNIRMGDQAQKQTNGLMPSNAMTLFILQINGLLETCSNPCRMKANHYPD